MENEMEIQTADARVTYHKRGLSCWKQVGNTRLYMDEWSWSREAFDTEVASPAHGNPHNQPHYYKEPDEVWIAREDAEMRHENIQDFILTVVMVCVMTVAFVFALKYFL